MISFPLSLLGESESLLRVIPTYLGLEPSLRIATLFLEFLLTGAIAGLVYAIVLKARILRMVSWSAGGFALASLIGPIFGNLIGDLFGSLLVGYLITFLIIGATFGKFLSFGIYNKEKEGSTAQ